MSANRDSQAIRLPVKVTPNAGRNDINGFKEGFLQVRVAAPPDKGKANKELINYLGEKLGVKKSSIIIIKGFTSRNKLITIAGISREELIKRISI